MHTCYLQSVYRMGAICQMSTGIDSTFQIAYKFRKWGHVCVLYSFLSCILKDPYVCLMELKKIVYYTFVHSSLIGINQDSYLP